MFALDALPPEPCVSLVIQGRLISQEAGPVPETVPGAVVLRGAWHLTFKVESVVIGDFEGDALDATGIQHGHIREDYGRTFLLARVEDGYRLVTISPDVLVKRQDIAALAAEVGSELCEG
ncbi:hypothetical protein [Brevundimonas sp. A19_0]|uniref:hypothetical protein n=1 Tax=Brevundimonas sp. A19_0 TaxID=2821087 RepID=UPI001ADB3E2A|nr:hypothetical protein [Brevundimonas sp. A19_0]MBO9502115.1 hypothetical protein [Brevundimonas sp. A19_0]